MRCKFLVRSIVLAVLLWGSALPTQGVAQPVPDEHPFAAYLAAPDTAYRYTPVHTRSGDGVTTHVLRMVSQRWLTEEQVDEPTWWHWVTLVVPDTVEHNTALLWIGGGSRDDDPPTAPPEFLGAAARATNAITVHLHNVPFQPLRFTGDPESPRTEDALIAYGWRQFLEGGARDEDATWLARLPMTKAAIHAMDTVTDYTQSAMDTRVERFIVAGASKRGWTTWTTGVFDDRVVAIAPAVIDLLNMQPSFEHHWRAYGAWSPAIRDYEEEGIMVWQESEEFERLRTLVDPYSYRDQLTMPKLILNAASDEFFLPDSWQFYWADLPGEKHLRYVPNTGHSLEDTDAQESLIAFVQHHLTDTPRPRFDWHVDGDTLRIHTNPDRLPQAIRLWTATNPETRDFRVDVIGQRWAAHPVTPSDDGRYAVPLESPETGYRAHLVEAVFAGPGDVPLPLSTGVVVRPDTYPHPPFEPEVPQGTPLR